MRTLIASTALLVLAACSPLRTETPIPPVTAPAGSGAATQPSGATPATQPPAAATVLPPPAGTGPVGLQINAPADGAVVSTSVVTVAGSASPGAVVTVNDDIIVVGADGQFHDDVTLTEGPNVIEIIASNAAGAEESVELTVTYEP